MKYDVESILRMINNILDWKESEKTSATYKELQVLKRIIEMDLGLEDY